jgi:hypothetical protein
VKGRHGLVWVCRTCRAGAATLPILRQVAPRTFVNRVWQAALHDGRGSRILCPACRKPFIEFAGARQLKVCVRCFWVWLGCDGTSSLAGRGVPALTFETRASVRAAPTEARRVLGALSVDVVVRALSTEPVKRSG